MSEKPMTPKEYLNQARDLTCAIGSKQRQIEELDALARSITSTLEAVKVNGTRSHRKIEDVTAEIDERCNELAELASQYAAKYREIRTVIDSVENPKYRQLLELRYLEFKTWEQVAVEMHYSYVHVVHRIHPKALNEVKDVIECNTDVLL